MATITDSLHRFDLKQSEDPVKTDLELTCGDCGEVICDVEADDNLKVLAQCADDHVCKDDEEAPVRKWIVNGTSMVVEAETAEEAVKRAEQSSGWHWEATEVLKEGVQTWTFMGHWDNDRIVVEHAVRGEVQDEREDTGQWEQGLWAASGTGMTMEEAEANAVAEYEAEYNNDEEN